MSQDKMTSTAQGESIKVIRFDGKNFSLWKLKIMALLETWDLLEVVEKPIPNGPGKTKLDVSQGTSTSESSGSTSSSTDIKVQEKHLELVKKGKKAYATLVNCLSNEQLSLVSHVPLGNAHEVWNILIQRYERKTTASKAHTRDMLHKCKKESKESFDAYLSRVMQLILSLKEMKEVISEGELMYVLFNGLPAEYDSVVQSLKVNDQVKFNDACQHIRDCEEVMVIKHQVKEDEAANHVKDSRANEDKSDFSSRGRGNKFRGRGRGRGSRGTRGTSYRGTSYRGRGGYNGHSSSSNNCYTCGKPGHYAAECEEGNTDIKRCDHCKKVGHTKQECRILKRELHEKNRRIILCIHRVQQERPGKFRGYGI
jgi:hypothetical protein